MQSTPATRLTVYIGDDHRHGRRPLHRAIMDLLQEEGIAGATVLHGMEGYGSDRRLRSARILDLSGDLPLVLIAVDRPEKIAAVLPKIEPMIEKGLVTTEEVSIEISRPREL